MTKKVDTNKTLEKMEQKAPQQQGQKEQDPVRTVQGYLKKMSGRIADALPKHMTADRLAQITVTTLRLNPALQQCTIESLLGAVMQSAQVGLEPNQLGQCYFIPFRNNKSGTMEVQFQIGYKGMIDLARRSGELMTIQAKEVHENDEFHFEYGLNEDLRHIPARTDRGEIQFFYAYAKLSNGGHAFEVMSKEDIDAIRDEHSQAHKYDKYKTSPWSKHYDAMAKKTVIKQLLKYLPISVELQKSIQTDETYRKDVTSEPEFVDYSQYGDVINEDQQDNNEQQE